MKKPICLSCGELAVREARLGLDRWDVNRKLMLDGWFRFASVQHRVCTSCGYIHAFVHREEDRAFIAQHWGEEGGPTSRPGFTLTPVIIGVIAAALAMGIALFKTLSH